jgi:hypothetical protein
MKQQDRWSFRRLCQLLYHCLNWTQVRIDASINIMNAILSSSIMVFIFQFIFKRQIADIAVSYADKLIDELKK